MVKPVSPVLEISNLHIEIDQRPVIKGIDLTILPNEIVALVGESGSGKSVTAHSIMGLLPKNTARISTGTLKLNGERLNDFTAKAWQSLRGNRCGMVFQEPQSSLNPSMKCGTQVAEIGNQHLHPRLDNATMKQRILNAFQEVQLADPIHVYNAYPHQLSGGQKQRVMMAMALFCAPQLLIADEPTTALDVVVQKEIIGLLKKQQQKKGMSVLFISHDLNVVRQLADKIAVMKAGKIVEFATKEQLFRHPQHPYTKGLLNARPPLDKRLVQLPTLQHFLEGSFQPKVETTAARKQRQAIMYDSPPVLEIKGIAKNYTNSAGLWSKKTEKKALTDIHFNLYPGETLGVVGASGCGKSTLAKMLVQLLQPNEGKILWKGKPIETNNSSQKALLRKKIQLIFQDPLAALHPQKTVAQMLDEVLRVHTSKDKKQRTSTIQTLLAQVDLAEGFADRYAHQLSGGQRQRVVIARALALEPEVLICDESVAALDISVQAQVLNLLNTLKTTLGLSLLFISHDLSVVKHMADRILVMNQGKIVEENEADQLYAQPQTKVAKTLIEAIL